MVCAYLEKLHSEYLEEKNNIDKNIENLQIQLNEKIEYIKLLEDSTDSIYESFSPRESNSENKLKLKEANEKREEIIQKMDELKVKQDEMVSKIEELENVIKIAECSIIKEEEIDSETDNGYESDVYRLKLLETQENERQRISRELHDSTVQNLTSIVHKTELCSKLIEIDPIRCRLELTMMSRTLREIINDTRQMIYDLRPMSFDDIGLEVTIERALDKVKNDMACNIGFTVEGEPYNINPVIGITILRIIQEACNNAIKYAESNIIQVKLIYEEDAIIISIEDDGRGFDETNSEILNRNDNSGFGLSMMKERVYLLSGEIEITSEENIGTKIRVRVPINNKEGN